MTIRPIDQQTMDAIGPVVHGENEIGCADGLALLQAATDHQPIKVFGTMLQASRSRF